jgi:hypothetical protein
MIPSDMIVPLDASNVSTLSVYNAPTFDGWRIDATTYGLIQATPANRPTYDRFTLCGGPAILFGGSGAPLYNEPTWLTGTVSFQIPFSITCFMAGDGVSVPFEVGNVGTGVGVKLGTDVAALTVRGTGGTATFTAAGGWNSSNKGQLLTITCDGTKAGTTIQTSDGVAVALASAGVDPGVTAPGSQPIVVGADHATANPLTGEIGFFGVIWGRVQSGAETTEIQKTLTSRGLIALASSWYLPPPSEAKRVNMIAGGDSIGFGHLTNTLVDDPTDPPYAYPNMAASVLGSRYGTSGVANNFALSSALLTLFVTVNPVITQWTGLGVPAIVSGMTNVAVLEGGVNDTLAINPTTFAAMQSCANTLYTRWVTLVTQVVSDLNGVPGGPHYIVVNTITPGYAASGAGVLYQAARWQANIQLKQKIASLGTANVRIVLMPIGLDPLLSSYQNPAFVPNPAFKAAGDPVHPSKAGHRHWGGKLGKLLLSLGL